MLSLEESVRQFIASEQLLTTGDSHLVALSGGADSVALLLALHRLGYHVEAAHCNFRLRGSESDRDEAFARNLCGRLGVAFHTIHFDTRTYASLHKVSIEMAARELRYRYFEQLRQDIGAGGICVAHHQDDAVETLLLNLVRGTGIHGLTGLRPRNGHVVRPLLCVSRAQILHYLNDLGQDYVTDSTNLVADVTRNKIRLQILPLLHDINPAASASIAKTARRMSAVERVFNRSVQASLEQLTENNRLPIGELLQHPAPEYLLFEWLTPRSFTPQQIEQIFDSLDVPSGRIFCSATHQVAVDRGCLVVEECRPQLPTRSIPEPGTYRYTEDEKWRFTLTDGAAISKKPECATLDASSLRFPLTIRPVQAGDRFQPFGMSGSRLVSDYLTDLKLTVFEKRRQLVVTDATGTIVWLAGKRTSQRFAVSTSTRQTLTIEVLKG